MDTKSGEDRQNHSRVIDAGDTELLVGTLPSLVTGLPLAGVRRVHRGAVAR